MHSYRLGGLSIDSEIELPGLIGIVSGWHAFDVTIRRRSVPPLLDDAEQSERAPHATRCVAHNGRHPCLARRCRRRSDGSPLAMPIRSHQLRVSRWLDYHSGAESNNDL